MKQYSIYAKELPNVRIGSFQTDDYNQFELVDVSSDSEDLDNINSFHRLIRECGSKRNFCFSELLLFCDGNRVTNNRDCNYPFIYVTKATREGLQDEHP